VFFSFNRQDFGRLFDTRSFREVRLDSEVHGGARLRAWHESSWSLGGKPNDYLSTCCWSCWI